MKVANIIEDGRIAGPQLRMLAVADRLKAKQIETIIIFPKKDSCDFESRLIGHQINFSKLEITRLQKTIIGCLVYLFTLPREVYLLWRFLEEGRFDVVHCSGGFWQIKGLLAAKFAGIRTVWHINDTILPSALRSIFYVAASKLATHLIFAGERVRDHYIGGKNSPAPFTIVQAPTKCEDFDPDLCIPDRNFDAYKEKIKICCIANLNPLKGLDFFIEMAAFLNKRYSTLTFHIVGPIYESQKGYVESLKEKVRDLHLSNVLFFHGASKNVKGVLKATDIYVCSSVSEASPTSVWEAMAMGKAIVSTDVGDVKAVMSLNQSGLVVPVRDGQALADAVAKFVDDPNLRIQFGRRARETAIDKLDLGACAEGHMRAYASCSNGKKTSVT